MPANKAGFKAPDFKVALLKFQSIIDKNFINF